VAGADERGAGGLIPSIELVDVTKVFPGGVKALDGASFAIAPGERCCLLGPNGAGKTTIIRMLEGALHATSGVVRLLGEPVSGSVRVKRRIGVVPQSPGLYPDLTVREYLLLVRRLYGRGSVEQTAATYGLGALLERRLAALSGGYARRLLVAAAVLPAPDLLLLDEPTVGLDPIAAAEIRSLLSQAMDGPSVLMSTHNLREAEQLCDTVIILREGTVLVKERIEALRRQSNPRVFLAADAPPDRLRAALGDRGIAGTVEGSAVWFRAEEPRRLIPGLLRGLLQDGLDVYESRIVEPTLEDLFLEVVRG
jgi:ABC-2 type transport system ATP-binding protein